MMKRLAASLFPLALLVAGPANAQLITEIHQVSSLEEGNPFRNNIVEVGNVREQDPGDPPGPKTDLDGFIQIGAFYDEEVIPSGPLYLTFDILNKGGTVPAGFEGLFPVGNIDRPFEGTINLAWFQPPSSLDLTQHPITSFAISPLWADVGETFSLRIDQVVNALVPPQPFAGTEFGLGLTVTGEPDDTAWTFHRFRLTNSDLTTALAPPASVPEPATWAMMLMGFFGLGSMVRRRRALGT